MLIMTRDKGESIFMPINANEEIEVKITRIKRGSVTVGIQAPTYIQINRFKSSQMKELKKLKT